MRTVLKWIAIGSVALLILEITIRLCVGHASFIYRGDVFLPGASTKHYFIKHASADMDSIVSVSTNAHGLRGAEPPISGGSRMVVVGSSTSRASYLQDHQTWPALLETTLSERSPTWIGNAGIDGSTSYANRILVEEYIQHLAVDTALLLIGINDRGKTYPTQENSFLVDRPEPLYRKWSRKSELANLGHKLLTPRLDTIDLLPPKRLGNQRSNEPSDTHQWDMVSIDEVQPAYKKNLKEMIDVLIKARITPVLITHPIRAAEGTQNAVVMERYNDTMRALAAEENILLIDLSHLLAKKPEYYVDSIHFSAQGNAAIAGLISEELARLSP